MMNATRSYIFPHQHDRHSLPRTASGRFHRRYARRHAHPDGSRDRLGLRPGRPGAGTSDRPRHESRVLRPRRLGPHLPSRKSRGPLGDPHPRRRRTDRGTDGALRIGADPRPRHPGGARSDPDRTEPDVGEGCGAEAALLGAGDRHRRALRRRGTDHHDGRCVRLAVRAGVPPLRRRAQDAARRGSRGGHVRGVRDPGGGRAARGRIAALRVEATELHPRRLRLRGGGWCTRPSARARTDLPRCPAPRPPARHAGDGARPRAHRGLWLRVADLARVRVRGRVP